MVATIAIVIDYNLGFFVGEEAADTGGPRREFWQLLVSKCQEDYLVGNTLKTFAQNTVALQV